MDTVVNLNKTAFLFCDASYDANVFDLNYVWKFNGKTIQTKKDPFYKDVRLLVLCWTIVLSSFELNLLGIMLCMNGLYLVNICFWFKFQVCWQIANIHAFGHLQYTIWQRHIQQIMTYAIHLRIIHTYFLKETVNIHVARVSIRRELAFLINLQIFRILHLFWWH